MAIGKRRGAKSGSNSDITSLSGLTTALSVAQGGTSAKTTSGARAALGAAAPITYASAETLTGDTWIDGKPIYRKILSFTNLAPSGDRILDAALTGSYISTLIKGYGSFKANGIVIHLIPIDLAETSYIEIHIAQTGLSIYFTAYFGSANEGHVVVEYTKA